MRPVLEQSESQLRRYVRFIQAAPIRSAWLADTVTRRIRSEVTLKGGSLFTERPLAMRERFLSGSGWKERKLRCVVERLSLNAL
jgi:hypothetical protein